MPPTDDQISRYLADPLSFPPEFKNWVVKYLEQHQPSLLIRQLAGTLLPSRIAGYPGSAGKVLAGDGTWITPSGYRYAYTEVTSSASISATTQAGATIFITCNAVTFDGSTAVLLEVFVPAVAAGVASQTVSVNLWDGTTDLGSVWTLQIGSTGNMPGFSARREVTPSAGSHTFKAGAWNSSSTSTMAAGTGSVGGTVPMFLKVTKA